MDNSGRNINKYSDLYDRFVRKFEERKDLIDHLDDNEKERINSFATTVIQSFNDDDFKKNYEAFMRLARSSDKIPTVLEDLPDHAVENEMKKEEEYTINQSEIDAGNFPKDGIFEDNFIDFLNYISEQKESLGQRYSYLDKAVKDSIESWYTALENSKDADEFRYNYRALVGVITRNNLEDMFSFLPADLKTYNVVNDVKEKEPRNRVYDGQYNDIINAIEDKLKENEELNNQRLMDNKRQWLYDGLKRIQDSKNDEEFIANYNYFEQIVNNQSLGFAIDYILDDLNPDFKKSPAISVYDSNGANNSSTSESGSTSNGAGDGNNGENNLTEEDPAKRTPTDDSESGSTSNGAGDGNNGENNLTEEDPAKKTPTGDSESGSTSNGAGDGNNGDDDGDTKSNDDDKKKKKKPGLLKIIGKRFKKMSRKKKIMILCIALAALIAALNPAVQAALISNLMLVNSWLWHVLPIFQTQLAGLNSGVLAAKLTELGIANTFNPASGVWTLAGVKHLSVAAPMMAAKGKLIAGALLGGGALTGLGVDKLVDKVTELMNKKSSPEYKEELDELEELTDEELEEQAEKLEKKKELDEAEKLSLKQRLKVMAQKRKNNRKIDRKSKEYWNIYDEFKKTYKKAKTEEELDSIFENYKGKAEAEDSLTKDDKNELISNMTNDVEKKRRKIQIKNKFSFKKKKETPKDEPVEEKPVEEKPADKKKEEIPVFDAETINTHIDMIYENYKDLGVGKDVMKADLVDLLEKNNGMTIEEAAVALNREYFEIFKKNVKNNTSKSK